MGKDNSTVAQWKSPSAISSFLVTYDGQTPLAFTTTNNNQQKQHTTVKKSQIHRNPEGAFV
jgi:hypothetical protein